MRRGIISSCQSATTSEIVKRCCSSLCKQRYSKYSVPLGGVHYVELTPDVQQHKWRKTKSMGNAVFRSLSVLKPFDGFSKKFVQLIMTSTPTQVQMLLSVSIKEACLRMREVVAIRRLFLITF